MGLPHFAEHRRAPFGAYIFFQGGNLFHRQVQLIISCILDGDIVTVHAGKFYGFNAQVLAYAVHVLHHIVSHVEVGEIADLPSPAGASYPPDFLFPQHIAGSEHCQLVLCHFITFGQDAVDKVHRRRHEFFGKRNVIFLQYAL